MTDGYAPTYYSEEELIDLLIRFVRIAHKRKEKETIEETMEETMEEIKKKRLIKIGPKGL